MAGKTEGGLSAAEFEARRREMSLALLAQSERFMDLDNQINQNFVRITSSIAGFLEDHPEALRASLAPIGEERREGDDLSGSGFAGSGLVDTVLGTVGDVLKGEKEFIQRIVSRVLGL